MKLLDIIKNEISDLKIKVNAQKLKIRTSRSNRFATAIELSYDNKVLKVLESILERYGESHHNTNSSGLILEPRCFHDISCESFYIKYCIVRSTDLGELQMFDKHFRQILKQGKEIQFGTCHILDNQYFKIVNLYYRHNKLHIEMTQL